MGNYLLLCHGDRAEFSSFDVPSGSEVVYWGAPGYALPASVAWTAIPQIRMNPTDLESINKLFKNLPPLSERTLVGGKTYAPDLWLSGDNNLLCIAIDLGTSKYTILGNDWQTRLKTITARLNNALLHLLCCTGINPNPNLKVLDGLTQTDPENVIP